ncbi:host attachment protein [Mitsuaria sp. WAJ17]|nr:host attachment protein [Mitsuaria sp. WAJ17]
MKASELVDGHLRHAAADQRSGGTSLAPRQDPRRKRHLAFACSLAEQVEPHLTRGDDEQLVFLAWSPFLGSLKGHLGPHASKTLHAAVGLDLATSWAAPGRLSSAVKRQAHA